MHYIYGGKHTEGSETTGDTAAVTCGNCKRTKMFRQGMDTQVAIQATTDAIQAATDAGFFTGFTGHNHVTEQNFRITAIDRFGIVINVESALRITLPTLVEFLAWITPLNMTRVIEHVTDSGMTWTEAMDLEWSLAAEVKSVNVIEQVIANAIAAQFIAEDAETPAFRTASKHKNTRQARRFRKGA